MNITKSIESYVFANTLWNIHFWTQTLEKQLKNTQTNMVIDRLLSNVYENKTLFKSYLKSIQIMYDALVLPPQIVNAWKKMRRNRFAITWVYESNQWVNSIVGNSFSVVFQAISMHTHLSSNFIIYSCEKAAHLTNRTPKTQLQIGIVCRGLLFALMVKHNVYSNVCVFFYEIKHNISISTFRVLLYENNKQSSKVVNCF